jgi:chemotaxis receptor (MCP) glutamine deamidase CheD
MPKAQAFVPIRFANQTIAILAILRLFPRSSRSTAADMELFKLLSDEAALPLFGPSVFGPGVPSGFEASAGGTRSERMSENSPKFNPAVLPAEFMNGFEPAAKSKEPRHFLYPGQVFATREPIVISTILGSCAAVCLWDRHVKAGGMNHYLLPDGGADGANRLRYGNAANPELLKQVLALGCEIRNLQAKIFRRVLCFRCQSIAVVRNEECAARGRVSPLIGHSRGGKRCFGQARTQVGVSAGGWRDHDQEFRPGVEKFNAKAEIVIDGSEREERWI